MGGATASEITGGRGGGRGDGVFKVLGLLRLLSPVAAGPDIRWTATGGGVRMARQQVWLTSMVVKGTGQAREAGALDATIQSLAARNRHPPPTHPIKERDRITGLSKLN